MGERKPLFSDIAALKRHHAGFGTVVPDGIYTTGLVDMDRHTVEVTGSGVRGETADWSMRAVTEQIRRNGGVNMVPFAIPEPGK